MSLSAQRISPTMANLSFRSDSELPMTYLTPWAMDGENHPTVTRSSTTGVITVEGLRPGRKVKFKVKGVNAADCPTHSGATPRV